MFRVAVAGLFAATLMLASTGIAAAGDVLVIHHKVADYAKWRPVFDGHKSRQEAAGLTNPRVYQALDDANDITIVFDVADVAKAKTFTSSKDLKVTMGKAGVVGKPAFTYLQTAP